MTAPYDTPYKSREFSCKDLEGMSGRLGHMLANPSHSSRLPLSPTMRPFVVPKCSADTCRMFIMHAPSGFAHNDNLICRATPMDLRAPRH